MACLGALPWLAGAALLAVPARGLSAPPPESKSTPVAAPPAIAVAPPSAAAQNRQDPKDGLAPFLSLRPENGLYEGLAFFPDGRALALLRTDSASQNSLDAVELNPGAKPVLRFRLAPEAAVLECLVALPEGNFALLRTGEKEGTKALTVVGGDGKKKWEASNLWQVGWPRGGAAEDKKARVVLVQRTAGGGWTVAAREAGTGRPVGKTQVFEPDGRGLLRGLGLKPVSFIAGFTQLVGERPGAYDKKKDTRLPSDVVVVDALTGKVLRDEPIEDRYGWALSLQLRAGAANPSQDVFVRLADDGDATRVTLELVDNRGLIHPIALPGNPRIYDRQSLVVTEPDSEGRIAFSLNVDPVNAEAVARKKADPAALELFEVDTKSLPPGRSPHPGSPEVARVKASLRAHVGLSDRPVSWLRHEDTIAVLRRFKSFARGGDQVDIVRLLPLP